MSPAPYSGLPIISTVVVASPGAAAETVIAKITVGSVTDAGTVLDLAGWAALTVGTSGTAVRLRIRQTGLTGTLVGDTGALTGGIAAGNLIAQDLEDTDTPGEVASLAYVLTLQVTGGAAQSTVSAVKLRAVPFG